MKHHIIVADPAWNFSDGLTMDSVKRGASSQYDVLDFKAIKALPVERVCADDALLALWVPSSMLVEGLEVMEAWGFKHKQTFIWVKVKVNPFEGIIKAIKKDSFNNGKTPLNQTLFSSIKNTIESFDLNDALRFGMGRLLRNTHEIALIGTKGKIYSKLKNKSQRTVHFYKALKHSAKPEGLQDKLDIMFKGSRTAKLEMFARRQRKGWTCVGNEVEGPHFGEDIRDSLDRLSNTRKRKTNESSTTQLQL